jgi:hypothetical protein
VAAQQQLRQSQLKDFLDEKLRERPSADEEKVLKIINFAEDVQVYNTFRKSEYNRRPDSGATFRNLTPALKAQIREELNEFKRTEMAVHEESKYLRIHNRCAQYGVSLINHSFLLFALNKVDTLDFT